MSHSRIFQINSTPVREEDYIKEDDFCEHWFIASIADYVSSDCNREDDVRNLRDRLTNLKAARFGIDEHYAHISFVVLPGGKESYFAGAYEAFVTAREKTLDMGLTDFATGAAFAEPVRLMGDSFDSEFGYYVSVGEDEIITLDEFIRDAEIGTRYYIGGTLDYHY